jgi:hypothetical protein
MDPKHLQAENFQHYPPQAQSFATANLDVLKRMPLALLALILRQVIQYDWNFPAEQRQLSMQLNLLKQMDNASFEALMSPFSAIPLSPALVEMDWVNHPQQFSEQLTAYLWSQHQIDPYHSAAEVYQQHLQKALDPPPPSTPRWTIVVIGKDSPQPEQPLFRHLAPHGTLFTQLNPAGALDTLIAEIHSRAQQHPLAYGHWYIDGGEPSAAARSPGLTMMSYSKLAPVAKQEFASINQFTKRTSNAKPAADDTQSAAGNTQTAAVEAVSSYIAGLRPEDLGLKGTPADAPLRHFEVNLLTQGAGCQIFSTTFVQWASRECLHRAQPLTLLARFATRQINAPMEQLLTRDPLQQPQDKVGSLIDADMGAYYTWINQSRLPGADQSCFLVWFEDRNLACAISPTLARGVTSSSPATMQQVLGWMRS